MQFYYSSFWCLQPNEQQSMLEENSQAIQECLKQSKFKHYTAKTTSTPFTMRFSNESIGRLMSKLSNF